MDLFERIFLVAESTELLDQFVSKNIYSIDDFHNTEYFSIKNFKTASIEKFILLKYSIIEKLDYSKSYNKAFISILLEFSERFNLISATLRIYSVLEDNDVKIGFRLQAGLMYLYNVDSNSRLIERFQKICELIEKSIEYEEDNETKSICTFLNYYATVIINTHTSFTELLINKINYALSKHQFHFLKNPAISDVLKFQIFEPEACYIKIQSLINKLLEKKCTDSIHSFEPNLDNQILIEKDTDYANILRKSNKTFSSIRNISVIKLCSVKEKEDFFFSLGRGVSILENENQLFLYMNSFGKMHNEKLITAFQFLPDNIINENISLIDWGSGQAIATISYFDFIKKNNVKNVALIEPSKLAIKRGALHVREYNEDIKINTVNKDLDSLKNSDLSGLGANVNLHFFSNILDIDFFSLKSLIEKIETNFKGKNYFVCVSPYITDLKTSRLDAFMLHFNNHINFKVLCSINNRVGEWKNNWSRVVRVFEVNI